MRVEQHAGQARRGRTTLHALVVLALMLLGAACGQATTATEAETDTRLTPISADAVSIDAAQTDTSPADASPSDVVVADVVDASDAVTADVLADDATQADAVADALDVVDTADVPAVPDVPDLPDVPDVPDVADVPDSQVDAGNGSCFMGGPPAADAYVVDAPSPDVAGCPNAPLPEGWYGVGNPIPPPQLDVTLGQAGADGNFKPYVEGGWAPIAYGFQGGIHVWAGLTVALPGVNDATATVDVQVWAESACTGVASGLGNLLSLLQLQPGLYTNTAPGQTPLMTQFYVPASSVGQVCGQWITLHGRVHHAGSGAWGEAQVSLRLYDSKSAMP